MVSNFSKKFISFEEARSFVRKLGLNGEHQWREYCKSGKKPNNIPYHPERSYKNKGWISFGDFFGTGIISVKEKSKKYWSFEKSKKFIHSLYLKNDHEWREFSKSNKRPEGIPTNPRKAYGEEWTSLGDWLGTGTIATQQRKYSAYLDARKEVRIIAKKYNIKTWDDWRKATKEGKIPSNIPYRPDYVYSKKRKK